MTGITLRPVTREDLDRLFEIQQDPLANQMVAFTSRDRNDRKAFMENWEKIFSNPECRSEVIVREQKVVGNIGRFLLVGAPCVGYWVDRSVWGQGVATDALRLFLSTESIRPLFARVAFDNVGSIRVLQKNGFVEIERDKFFSQARNQEIEEVVLKLK